MINITVTKNKIFVGSETWGPCRPGLDLGDQVLNVLFYLNRDGQKPYRLTVDGIDETDAFKKAVKDKYQDIPNTDLRDRFFQYANVN